MYIYLEEKRKAQSKGENCARQGDTDEERVKLREARQRDHERERRIGVSVTTLTTIRQSIGKFKCRG